MRSVRVFNDLRDERRSLPNGSVRFRTLRRASIQPMRKVIALLALACTPALFTQSVTIGTLPQSGTTQFTSSPQTFIDLTHPAGASGAISSVSVRWSINGGGSCANAFKVKFIHPNANGTGFSVTERGPFTATNGLVTVQLSPPVNVAAGDYIGVSV